MEGDKVMRKRVNEDTQKTIFKNDEYIIKQSPFSVRVLRYKTKILDGVPDTDYHLVLEVNEFGARDSLGRSYTLRDGDDPISFAKRWIGVKNESLQEDTVKQGNSWVNKGKEGTHGKFKTKKGADAQRKAMFANGYRESMNMRRINKKSIRESIDEKRYSKDRTAIFITFESQIEDKVNELIGEFQYEYGIESGDIQPLLSFELGDRIDDLADTMLKILDDEVYSFGGEQ